MGAYLDRLNAQFDELRAHVDETVDRAATESRDVTDTEAEVVKRETTELTRLRASIEDYTAAEVERDKVTALRATVTARPTQRVTGPDAEAAYDVAREFPTPGHYAIAVHRAMVDRSPEARDAIERATAHQTTADNPGLIPRPILGPLINLIDGSRPFLGSVTKRPLPTQKFDRPVVNQHVLVGIQAAEKTLTDSRKLTVGTLPVEAVTFAGHLNISRQDIKWTSPSILNIVYDDFAVMYARATEAYAVGEFLDSVTGADVTLTDNLPATLTTALYDSAATALTASTILPDTMWVSPDRWAGLGAMVTPQGAPAFPSLSISTQSGNPLGLKLVVVPTMPSGTMVLGPSRFVEWYEDVDGLLQVGEPDVLGQLVGYAGYGAIVDVLPAAFAPIVLD